MTGEEEILDAVAEAVEKGEEEETVSRSREALEAGIPPARVIGEGLCRGMQRAGEHFAANRYFLPELLLSSEAMHAGIEILAPLLKTGEKGKGEGITVVLGVVEGDVHEIGKNLVKVMLEADGYQVVDMGYNVPPGEYVRETAERNAAVLALSTMMTTTLPAMRETIRRAREMNPRPLILVGGAPLSRELALDMGADDYGENAAVAPHILRKLLQGRGESHPA